VVAVTRSGGRGAQVETGGLEVQTARVKHLTSREGDPHRHVHLMVNTRVKAPDGEWRGLYSAAVRQHIRAVNERGTRILVTDRELREVLAGEGYSLGGDGEIDQARGAVELLSKRTALVAQNRVRFEAEWRAAHPGREPSRRVWAGWDRQAWEEGRKAKPHGGETPEQMGERVRVELAAAGFDFTPGAMQRAVDEPVRAQAMVSVGRVDRDRLAGDVVAVLSAQRSAWTVAELTAQVEAMVAGCGVVGEAQAVTELVEDVHARASERCVSVLDGEVHAPTVMSRHLTSPQVVDADARLNLGLAGLAGGPGDRDGEGARLADRDGFDSGQAEAVGAVCGDRRLEVIVGPAGTGKTRMLDGANRRLGVLGREMVLLAPTLKAAQVAAGEVGIEGLSVSKLLHQHGFRWDSLGRWSRLEPGQVDAVTGTVYQGPTRVLSARSVIVVDEAGLVTVDQANALIDVAAETGASVRLVGDPRQLGAVGRGGVMETASRWATDGPVVLDQVHRFLTVAVDEAGLPVTRTDVDYAALSLRLREGTDPDGVVDQLLERGQVVVHATRAEVIAELAGQVAAQEGEADGLAVTVATNADADDLNRAVRQLRVAAGHVDDTHTAVGMGGARIGVGDRIVTRRNDTARNVANRETWTVQAVGGDGTVHAYRAGRHVTLDADYLVAHTQLGYATTDYGNQGVTANRSVTWVTEATTAGGLYVGAARGRYQNTLHVVAEDLEAARNLLVAAAVRDRADRGLDAARALAEGDALAVGATAGAGVGVDRRAGAAPLRYGAFIARGEWWTAAELDAQGEAVKARLARELGRLGDVPVPAEGVLERDNRADRAAAVDARQRADWHRGEAERLLAGRAELAERADVEYSAARDDARVVEAGPGRFGRKTGQVEAAQARRAETARRWLEPQLPGGRWSDETVAQAAGTAVDRVLKAEVSHHRREAGREDEVAADLGLQVTARDDDRRDAVEINERRAVARNELVAAADAEQARIIRNCDILTQVLAEQTATVGAVTDGRRPVPAARSGPSPVGVTGPGGQARQEGFDPADWRTAAELAAEAAAVKARLAEGLRLLADVPVMAERARHQDDQADRIAAVEARRRAEAHRGEADRISAGRGELTAAATAEYLAARDAAWVIEGGPGRFGRKADRVEAAQARRDETARRWAEPRLPRADWSDEAVRLVATTAAGRVVTAGVGHHRGEAQREGQVAARLDRQIEIRDRDHQAAIRTNEQRAHGRRALIAEVDHERVRVAHNLAVRAERTADMTAEEIAGADQAHHTYRETLERQQVGMTVRGPSGRTQPRQPGPGEREQQRAMTEHAQRARRAIQERGGPGIEM